MQPRIYRNWIAGRDLVAFTVTVRETDLYIRATTNLARKAYKLVEKYRGFLETYITKNPLFLTTLEPIVISEDAPAIVRRMATATAAVGVGPMTTVSGAIAEFVGRDLLELSPEIIVENGGEIFLKSLKNRVIGIYAGKSPLSGKIGVEISARDTPLGVCTSSGTVGHSVNFGKADAVVTISADTILADASATAIANRVQTAEDIDPALKFAESISGLSGVVIIKDEVMGVWGKVKLCPTTV
ncbi:MAG: UPF0280 family protein [Dehalococcoidales bacterium]|nr:UPF0280 family protein [Dehalococcoidales bacterium]